MAITKPNNLHFRKERVRRKVFGTPQRPRLSVRRSLNHIYAQLIDDTSGRTLLFESSLSKELKGQLNKLKKAERAKKVGELLAKKAIEKNIKNAVFDRGGRQYHGRIKSLADAARQAGLKF